VVGFRHEAGSRRLTFGRESDSPFDFICFLKDPASQERNGTRNIWIPTTSLDQYGATLASWFGVNSTDMQTVFPTLKNFTTQNIAFI